MQAFEFLLIAKTFSWVPHLLHVRIIIRTYMHVVPREKNPAIGLAQTQLLSRGEKAQLREAIVGCSESSAFRNGFSATPSPATHAHARSSTSGPAKTGPAGPLPTAM